MVVAGQRAQRRLAIAVLKLRRYAALVAIADGEIPRQGTHPIGPEAAPPAVVQQAGWHPDGEARPAEQVSM